MLEIHNLRVLRALADHRSFTRAAASLGLTQSAVSHQMKRIEEIIGVPLVRHGRGVNFTPAGDRLATKARQVLAMLEQARAWADEGAAEAPESIRIGAPASFAAIVLPEVLREFLECFPRTAPVLTTSDSPGILAGVREGKLDLGILLKPAGTHRDVELEPLADDRLAAVVHPLHAWARAGRIDRRSAGRQQYILYDAATPTGRMVQAHLRAQGAGPERCLEVGNIEVIKQLVRLGLGVTYLAEWACAAERSAGTLSVLAVARPELRRSWVTARMGDRGLSLAERTLLSLCVTAARLRMGAAKEV